MEAIVLLHFGAIAVLSSVILAYWFIDMIVNFFISIMP